MLLIKLYQIALYILCHVANSEAIKVDSHYYMQYYNIGMIHVVSAVIRNPASIYFFKMPSL